MLEDVKSVDSDHYRPTQQEIQGRPRMRVSLVCENLRSLYNVGAIFRTADAVLVEKIYLTGLTGTPPSSRIQKTALGATEVVPWEYRAEALDCVTELKRLGYAVVALERTKDSKTSWDTQFDYPLCLVVGNEITGVSPELLALADYAVELPMLGRAVSLNVATACGVALYELARQWKARLS
ncbi:RNA methyltransferase [Candidatus Peregrinibacteria bacterium CG_4_9_14_0_2_um_filter_53_11]|nr:MAG: RNA methyltransferase [Candidatus Peregrinibacteria bacterium CG_4_9_14_0_2_um_filter_53_11]